MVVVDTLTVEVEADIKDFDSNLNRGTDSLKKFDGEAKKVGSSIGKSANTLNALNTKLTSMKTRLKGLEIGSKEFKKLQKEIRTTEKAMDRANNKTSTFGKIVKGALGFLSVAAVIQFGKQLFKLGSDAEEIGSKFNTVFKGIEDQTRAVFTSMAQNVGRSALELQKFGSDLGDVLKPLGFATQEAADLSAEMVQLAVDVASFNNVQDEQAINAFRSALTGEREALKTLGIVISEADVKQEALNRGLIKQGEELSKQDKALATYSLLLQNTADAQGDAVRTADSFANQIKRL